MTLEQTRELLNAAAAVYPNTYRAMDEQTKLRLLDEATATLEKYDYQDCVDAWAKYRAEYQARELNLALFVGVVKDIRSKRNRETQKRIETKSGVVRDNAWHQAKAECFKKCQSVFGWTDEQTERILGGRA